MRSHLIKIHEDISGQTFLSIRITIRAKLFKAPSLDAPWSTNFLELSVEQRKKMKEIKSWELQIKTSGLISN